MSTVCQETVKDDQPVTDEVPDEFEITILRSYREHSAGLPKADLEQQAAPPRQNLMHGRFIVVHFVIGVIDKRTGEVWNCRMRPIRTENGTKVLDINDGEYKIESSLEPAMGITDISSTCWKGDALPPYSARIDFMLLASVSMQYHVTLKLFSLEGANKRELSTVLQKVTTFPEDTDLAEIQEGSGLDLVERPLQKTKPKGILARAKGWKIIMHFQNLVDNGEQECFRAAKETVWQFVRDFPRFSDILPCVLQEENFLYQDQRSVETSQKAVRKAIQYHSPNEIFFLLRAKCAEAFWCAKVGNFLEARGYLEQASEISNEMAAGQFKAILCYEWAQYYAEKAASQGDLSEQEWEDAERYFNGVVQYHNGDDLMKEVGNNRLLLKGPIRHLTLYLRTSRRDVPNFDLEISHTVLGKAADLLNKIRRHFHELHAISKKHQVLLWMFETDLHIRNKNYDNALESCARGMLLARELERANLTRGMEARLRHVFQQNEMMSAKFEQLMPQIGDSRDGVGADTDNQNPETIEQLLHNLRITNN